MPPGGGQPGCPAGLEGAAGVVSVTWTPDETSIICTPIWLRATRS